MNNLSSDHPDSFNVKCYVRKCFKFLAVPLCIYRTISQYITYSNRRKSSPQDGVSSNVILDADDLSRMLDSFINFLGEIKIENKKI